MTDRLVAALPMYEWPERRATVDAEWQVLRDGFRARGIDAPERLARRNADLPPVPGGIRDQAGHVIAPDPATLPPDDFDLKALWLHPDLLFTQTCWGPMELGLQDHVHLVGQDDYGTIPGCAGPLYSSALVMRRAGSLAEVAPDAQGAAILPVKGLRGLSLAFNSTDSMSGWMGLSHDLETLGENIYLFARHIETGGHRLSIRAVSDGRADIAAIDARSWQMAGLYEPAATDLKVVGWTSRRKGLPFIASKRLAPLFEA